MKKSDLPNEPLRVIIEKTRSEKFWKGVWSFIKILFVLFLIGSFFNAATMYQSGLGGVQKKYFDHYFGVVEKDPEATSLAVISLFGEISDVPLTPFSDGTVLSDDIIFLLHQAAKDTEIDAVLLRIDSPGGTVLASEKIVHMVQELKQTKPVFALLEGSATSGGYYIASAADKIYAYRSSITGNIGVTIILPKVQELLEKIGVDMRTLSSGDLKDIGSPFRDLTAEETQVFQALITESYEAFISTVAKGRGLNEETVRELADGRIYSGAQASQNGLIDEAINSFAEAMNEIGAELGAEKVQPVSFKLPYASWWEEMLLNMDGNNIIPTVFFDWVSDRVFGNGPRLMTQ